MQMPSPQVSMQATDWLRLAITATATLTAAFGAATMTLFWQRRKEKRDAKMRVFTNLMMHRKASPPTYDWVNSDRKSTRLNSSH